VSPLFHDRLLVGLAPAEVSLVRVRGLWPPRVVDKHSLACDPGSGDEPWHGAVAVLKSVELRERCDVTVIVSNHFVRYAIVPWNDALLTPAEEEAYVRHHFAKVYGECARGWSLRSSEVAPAAPPRLASAVDSTLIQAIRVCFPRQGRVRLVSIQPYLMVAINRFRTEIPNSGAWLVLAEPGRACVALHAGGGWRSVQSTRGSWIAALERERHRVEGEVPDLVLLAGAPPEPMTGWTLRALRLEDTEVALSASNMRSPVGEQN
jgi:hypothetical protein